jgi:hypothetical protein
MPNSTVVTAPFDLGFMLHNTCPLSGNGDLYGLGVRIGLYFQIFTAQISGLASHVLEVDDSIGHKVVIFILATGTVLFRLILRNEIEAVEVFPILSLLVVQLGACRVPFWKKPMTVAIYLVEVVCLLGLATWFWFYAMDILPRSCRDDYAFFFKKVSIWHWFRKFSQACTVIAVIGGGVGVLVYLLSKFSCPRDTLGSRIANVKKCYRLLYIQISHNGLEAGGARRIDEKTEKNTQ